MNLRKAAEMALEALMERGEHHQKVYRAAEALSQALAQPEQEPVAWADKVGAVIPHSHKLFQPDLLKDYTRPLYTAPVDAVDISEKCVDETAKREHEPVGYVSESGKGAYILVGVDLEDDTPLYTAPPKREWIGLTDEQLHKIIRSGEYDSMEEFARAIEAKLKEKNT